MSATTTRSTGCTDTTPPAGADAIAAIEAMLAWSRDALSGLIGLGSLLTYLETGGPLDLVAARLRREIDRTQAALDQLPALLDHLRRVSEHGQIDHLDHDPPRREPP